MKKAKRTVAESSEGQHYKCEVCGAEVDVTNGGSGTLVCCGVPMILQTEARAVAHMVRASTDLLRVFAEQDVKEEIMRFIRENPNPEDADIHDLAEENDMDPHSFEEIIYSILHHVLTNFGKHNDVPDDQYDPDELKMGIEIEKEHTDDPAFAKNIAKDHLAEFSNYYTALKKMEDELKGQKGESASAKARKAKARARAKAKRR